MPGKKPLHNPLTLFSEMMCLKDSSEVLGGNDAIEKFLTTSKGVSADTYMKVDKADAPIIADLLCPLSVMYFMAFNYDVSQQHSLNI